MKKESFISNKIKDLFGIGILSEDVYYNYMCHISPDEPFKSLHHKWYKCFEYTLHKWGFNSKSIHSLFYYFDMDNWTALHKDKTEYKDCSNKELIGHFTGECHYICDRMSYDRLFRTHWLFIHGFINELFDYEEE